MAEPAQPDPAADRALLARAQARVDRSGGCDRDCALLVDLLALVARLHHQPASLAELLADAYEHGHWDWPTVDQPSRASLRNACVERLLRTNISQDCPQCVTLRAARDAPQQSYADCCGGCGGPYRYDVSIPSVIWNRVIRAKGLSDYLCVVCILEAFVKANTSFTATLSGGMFTNRERIELQINGQAASDAEAVQGENNILRWRTGELEAERDAAKEALAQAQEYCRTAMRPQNIAAAVKETAWDRGRRSGLQEAVNAITCEADAALSRLRGATTTTE